VKALLPAAARITRGAERPRPGRALRPHLGHEDLVIPLRPGAGALLTSFVEVAAGAGVTNGSNANGPYLLDFEVVATVGLAHELAHGGPRTLRGRLCGPARAPESRLLARFACKENAPLGTGRSRY
jgi:hypothetical protein